MRLAALLFPAALAALALVGCAEEHHETISISGDPETFPTMKTVNVSTTVSDSGYTRYHITTPLWLVFDEAKEPHWDFPEGLYIVRFDNAMREDGNFTADTATYFSSQRLWRFDRNVRMRNTDGDRFLTQQLFWDQQQEKLYSDSFIHIERADRVIEGYGFTSDQSMTSYSVRRPTGIFPASDFHTKTNE